MNHFGNWLKREIENLGLTQREFCERSGFPFGSLRNWMVACPSIQGRNVARLARALGVTREVVETRLAEAEAADRSRVAAA